MPHLARDLGRMGGLDPPRPMPNQTTIGGARAIFGRPFNATMIGRNTAAVVGESRSKSPAAEPAMLPMRKPSTVSSAVTQASRSSLPSASPFHSSRPMPLG
ncbi:hypothetical protein [Belnapia rosea]|uniref:Uncharacterized protein n=1 Tax=Belnapia rosea TaxID=938405 RepID=A0A1G6KXF3_9PROT|nr:hypothetical protein [Belnapia rosea]SDC35145.1 hypothetical protein SAMN04487779_1001664 [Belnapia rosea]